MDLEDNVIDLEARRTRGEPTLSTWCCNGCECQEFKLFSDGAVQCANPFCGQWIYSLEVYEVTPAD